MNPPCPTLLRRFDPADWQAHFEGAASGYVFRQSLKMAGDLCLSTDPAAQWADIGCGTGVLVSALSRKGVKIIGVDEDPRMVQFAGGRFPRDRFLGPISLLIGRATSLPLRDNSLGGVVAVSLTGCLWSLEGFLTETYRVLCPGGWAIVTFTNRNSLLLRIQDAVQLSLMTHRPATLRRYRPDEVAVTYRGIGYQACKMTYYNCCLTARGRALPNERTAQIVDRVSRVPVLGRNFARNFVVVAHKPLL
jgi:SAM-dependent methyltransferase